MDDSTGYLTNAEARERASLPVSALGGNLTRGQLDFILGRAESVGKAWKAIKAEETARKHREEMEDERRKEKAFRKKYGVYSRSHRYYKINKQRRARYYLRINLICKFMMRSGAPVDLKKHSEKRRFYRLLRLAVSKIYGKDVAKATFARISAHVLGKLRQSYSQFSQDGKRSYSQKTGFVWLSYKRGFTTTRAFQGSSKNLYKKDNPHDVRTSKNRRTRRKNSVWQKNFPKNEVATRAGGLPALSFASRSSKKTRQRIKRIFDAIRERFETEREINRWIKFDKMAGLVYDTAKKLSRLKDLKPQRIAQIFELELNTRKATPKKIVAGTLEFFIQN